MLPMVTQAYDAWLFDLDGTLVDVDDSYPRETFERVGDRLGHEFTDEQIDRLWYGLDGVRDDLLRSWGLDPGEFWPTLHGVEDPQRRAEASYIHDDAADLLAHLDADDRPVGLVTHCAPFLTHAVLDELDLRSHLDAVVCCSDDLGWKPDPTPVERALAELDIASPVAADGGAPTATGSDTAVYAGDSESDVGAAWNAGLDAVHVERHGHERRGKCVLADHRVRSFDELPRE